MLKHLSKTTLLTLFISSISFFARAQLGYNFQQYDLGVAAGVNTVFGDIKTQTTTASIHFNFTYNQTPYTNFIFEAQLGRLEGGDSLKDTYSRQFTNDFAAFLFRGQLQLGELVDYSRSPFLNAVKNFYVSAGIGFIVNHITSINRTSINPPGVYTPGLDNTNEPFIPLKIGYEFKIYNPYQQPSVMIDVGYEGNFILGDNLDGFAAGTHNDIYSQFIIGIKFALGKSSISYRKQIPYNY